MNEAASSARTEKILWIIGILLFVAVLVVFASAPAWTRHPNIPPPEEMSAEMEDMPGMDHGMRMPAETPEEAAKHLGDKRESEFNHHLAGALVILAAIFFLAQDRFSKRWPAVRYAWPMCFLLAGFFLLLWSDTEIWPFGYQSFYFAVTHNPEDAQHKLFALILLALGAVETLRASGRLKSAWSAWVFPVVGICGAILLLFHHHGGMHGPDAMQTMMRVKGQHLRFAGVGVGIAVAKGISETRVPWRPIFHRLWPLLMIVLGVLLLLYTE
jgi:copper resistance protein D